MATGVRYIPLSWQRDIFEIYPVVMATIYPVVMAAGSHVPLLWQYAWVHFRNIPFLVNSMYDKYYIQFNKCICNLTSEYSFNCGFKNFSICLTWYILKWYISLITWAIGICLIYMPTPSGLRPSG